MAPYHNKVCDESRCCKSEYQCYGNCGDYTGLYIFLGVLGGLIFLCAVATSFRKRREEQVRCLPYTFSCAFPKLLCEKFVEFRWVCPPQAQQVPVNTPLAVNLAGDAINKTSSVAAADKVP